METLSEAETQEILKGVLGELVDSLKEKKATLEDYFDRISAIQRVSKHETRCWVAKMSDQRLLRDWDALEEEDELLPPPPESSDSLKRYRGGCYKKFKKDEPTSDDNSQGNTFAVHTSSSSTPAAAGNSNNFNSSPSSVADANLVATATTNSQNAGAVTSSVVSTKKVVLLESDSKIRCPIADNIMKKYENIRIPGERYRQNETEPIRYERGEKNSKHSQDISYHDYQNSRFSNGDNDDRRSNKLTYFKEKQPHASRSTNSFVKTEYSQPLLAQQQQSQQFQGPRVEQQKDSLNQGKREAQQSQQQDTRFDSLNDSFGVTRSSNVQQQTQQQQQQMKPQQQQQQPSFDSREYEDQVAANQPRFDSKEYFKRAQVAAESATVNSDSDFVERNNVVESSKMTSLGEENEKAIVAVPMTPKRQERVASSGTRAIQEEERTEGSIKKKQAKEFSYASPIQKVNQDWMELSSSVRQGISSRQSPSFR